MGFYFIQSHPYNFSPVQKSWQTVFFKLDLKVIVSWPCHISRRGQKYGLIWRLKHFTSLPKFFAIGVVL
jgi:hypothetical protein